MAPADVPARDLLKVMKDTANNVNNDDIIGFAFNPESRKRVETFGNMVGNKPPGMSSPRDHGTTGKGSVFSQSLEES